MIEGSSPSWTSYTTHYLKTTEIDNTALKVMLFVPRMLGAAVALAADGVRIAAYYLYLHGRVLLQGESINPRSIEDLWKDLQTRTNLSEIPSIFPYKSRFQDIPCAVRTVLKTQNGLSLPANRMGLEISERRMIASQYPYGNEHFWKTVYDESAAIIDLTGPRDRMAPYYPLEGESLVANSTKVHSISTQNSISIYQVQPHGLESKNISRLRFAAWPDHGVITVEELLSLVHQVELLAPNPLWVHCRAGVGRTGTLITALILKEQIQKGKITAGTLDKELVNLILRLRLERNTLFVQNQEQFRLLHAFALSLL